MYSNLNQENKKKFKNLTAQDHKYRDYKAEVKSITVNTQGRVSTVFAGSLSFEHLQPIKALLVNFMLKHYIYCYRHREFRPAFETQTIIYNIKIKCNFKKLL